MNRSQKAAVLSQLVKRLREKGSWAGEMHIQKCAYLLQEVTGVPLGFTFVPYKYGPFSFDLRDELDSMNADNLVEFEPQPFPYGPKTHVTPIGERLIDRFPKMLGRYEKKLEFISGFLAEKMAGELEELSTAYLVFANEENADDSQLANELRRLKPHVPLEIAEQRVQEARMLVEAAKQVRA